MYSKSELQKSGFRKGKMPFFQNLYENLRLRPTIILVLFTTAVCIPALVK